MGEREEQNGSCAVEGGRMRGDSREEEADVGGLLDTYEVL